MTAAPSELIERSALGALEYIAEGGQGRVYRCTTLRLPDYDGALAYKEFKSGQLATSGLEAIIGVRSRLTEADRHLLDAMSTWPTRLVRENGRVVGLLMPLIRDEFVQIGRSMTGSTMRKEREIQYLFLSAARCQKLGFPLVNLHQRYVLCAEMARVLALLHANGVIFGDLNAKNALFTVGPGRTDADLMLVDCDAVRVRGTMSAVPQLSAPDWEPPGDERRLLTQDTDRYKLGLFILRTLSPGTQASTARDPRRADDVVDEEGRLMLRGAVSSDPAARPSADAWSAYFTNLLHARTGVGAPVATPAPAPTRPAQPSPASPRPPAAVPPGQSAVQTTPGGWVRAANGQWVRPPRS